MVHRLRGRLWLPFLGIGKGYAGAGSLVWAVISVGNSVLDDDVLPDVSNNDYATIFIKSVY